MTKDVELHSSTWKTMKQAITGLTENSTISSSGYGNYTNAQAGAYGIGTASTGFAKRVEELVKISEKVQRLIAEKDTDGAVSYSYHDDTSTAQTLQSKLSTLERYAGNVPTYIKDKIDHPFYEAMDKVGAKLEALNIQQYKTTNKVGYKRIESMTDPYGHPVGTKEVVPTEIGIDELYKVDSPYRTALQKSYEEFKKSKDYKEHKLTETEYVQAMNQTRAFEYVSIDDEKSKIEMWRDIALGVGLVVLTIFCPPAGAVAGVALASADMYSAATGKDWGTGRELDTSERTLRGTFALFDLIPAGKYLGTLAKTGKTAGLTAVKNSLKTTLKEGLEQGTKNVDSFKGVLKNAKGLGDNVYHSLSTYRKQITHQLKNSVDEKVLNLSKATQEGLERAKQFTLEVPTVRVVQEASTGSQMMMFEKTSKSLGDTGLGKSLDNLASKAKNVENVRMDKLRARNATIVDNLLDNFSNLSPKDIPTVKSGNFEEFFNRSTSEQLDKIWENKHLRRKIERQLRSPGGMHEWHLVSRAPQFKYWGIKAEQIRELRTAISEVKFVNPSGFHGGLGSTIAHNELLNIIDSSLNYEMFVRRLNNWANYRLLGGVESLPEGLRLVLK